MEFVSSSNALVDRILMDVKRAEVSGTWGRILVVGVQVAGRHYVRRMGYKEHKDC